MQELKQQITSRNSHSAGVGATTALPNVGSIFLDASMNVRTVSSETLARLCEGGEDLGVLQGAERNMTATYLLEVLHELLQ